MDLDKGMDMMKNMDPAMMAAMSVSFTAGSLAAAAVEIAHAECRELLEDAENDAFQTGIGLWGVCGGPDMPVG